MNSDKLIYSVLRVCVCVCASEAGTGGADVGTGMECVCVCVCRFRYAFVLWIRVCVVEQLLARAWNVCMCVCTYGMCVHMYAAYSYIRYRGSVLFIVTP